VPFAPRANVPALALLLLSGSLAAQRPASLQGAVNSIDAEDITRRVGVLAHDSMRGRDTPSPELEQVAAYVAGEFRRFGLAPGGDDGTYVQRYGIVKRAVDTGATRITVTANEHTVALTAGSDVNILRLGPLPATPRQGPVVLVTGDPDPADPVKGEDVQGAWVAYVVTATPQGVRLDVGVIRAAVEAGAIGVLLISNRRDAQWRDRVRRIAQPAVSLEGGKTPGDMPGIIEIRDATARRTLGLDMARVRSDRAGGARRLAGVTLTLNVIERVLVRQTAPNVVGILEGSDSTLRHEYLVFSAHMDHVGVGRPVNGDSIYNGADDDASGTAAVMEAAEAFALLHPRPKRSIIFLTVSGEEKGLYGSSYFTDHPPVPMQQIIGDLNLDMVGRNWRDTIAVIGKEHSNLGTTLDQVAAQHPELHMQPVGDLWPQENFYFRSDHYNFARRGVPILFFFNGTHPDYHQPSDEVSRIDAEKASRITKLVFYLGLSVANAVERPHWNPDSYRRIVTGE
jgi:hypothetical protein